jgi:arylsulfatase A-like enzyme
LLDVGVQQQHEYLYWEFPGYRGQQALRWGDWKAVRRNLVTGEIKTQLYNLASDPGEARDLSANKPEVLSQIERWMSEAHTPSPEYPLQAIDRGAFLSSRFPHISK